MSQSDPPVAPVNPGDILAGKYRVDRVLGVGGMGVVVAAQHVQLGQKVALKFLHGAASRDPNAVERFLREARAVVLIQSEHVARVSDVGTLETGAPYIVMEFLNGTDLQNLVAARGPLPIEDAVEYVLQACAALAEAHKAGIVHRDLKPANLFLTKRPDGSPLVKVLDFGISKLQSDGPANPALTSTTAMFGSPLYMSPEQMRSSKRVDLRTDIWALGVVLHELMTAAHVFEADTFPGLCTAIATDPPVRLREKMPNAPEGLERALLRCLEKDPNLRFANVAELADALSPFTPQGYVGAERVRRILGVTNQSAPPASLANLPPAVGAASVPSGDTNGIWSGTANTGGTSTTGKKAASGMVIVGGLIGFLIVAGALGSFFAFRKTDGNAEKPSPSATTSVVASAATASAIAPIETQLAAVPAPAATAPDAGATALTSPPATAVAPLSATPPPTKEPPPVAAKRERPRPTPAVSNTPPATTPPAKGGDKGYDDRK